MAVLKDLIVHGPSRFINTAYFDKLETNAVKADSGIFNQLIATTLEAKNAHIDELTANNATVYGIMDVKGKLQTNQWEAASIANIGGNFYISPTGKSSTGTVTITCTSSATSSAAAKYSITMSGTFGVSSTSSTIWATGAYGMATGNVSVGTKKYPLGTCDGPLSNITTGTNTITGFTISNIESTALDIIFDENSSLISSNAISSKPGNDLQVSVYLGKNENNYMPIGILLTSYGKDNKQYIDIYDGTHSAGTSTSGFAEPVVRIGDLSGLSSYTQAGKYTIEPTGWGIYTTNGYFKGEIYADLGYIGGFTIGDTELYSQEKTNASSVEEGAYIGPSGFGISGGTESTTTYFTEEAILIGGLLSWNAADSSNLNINKANEIIVGELGEALILPNLDFLAEADPHSGFKIKTLLSNTLLEISNHKNQIQATQNSIKSLTDEFNDYYKPYINSTNNDPYYIEFKRKALNTASSVKITDTTIELSTNNQRPTTIFEGNLMKTTFGEFENLRMKANTYTNNSGYLTWIARSNGHLSLKVVK